MSITLYYHPFSQPSRSVLALLNIGQLKFEGKVVDLFKGEARSPEYLKINPFGGVPFLIHNDIHLSESNAILQYLCDAFPVELRGFYGNNSDERAQVNQLLSWYQSTFDPLFSNLLVCGCNQPKIQSPQVPKTAVNQTFRLLDKMLAKSTYMVGDHITIVDLLLFHEATNIEIYDFDLSYWHHVTAWYKTMQQTLVVGQIHKKFKEGLKQMKGLLAKAVIQK